MLTKRELDFHTLDVLRGLFFCLDRTGSYMVSPRLFVAFAERWKGEAISSERLLKWVSGCIKLCYELANLDCPGQVRGHSTRAQAGFVLL